GKRPERGKRLARYLKNCHSEPVGAADAAKTREESAFARRDTSRTLPCILPAGCSLSTSTALGQTTAFSPAASRHSRSSTRPLPLLLCQGSGFAARLSRRCRRWCDAAHRNRPLPPTATGWEHLPP